MKVITNNHWRDFIYGYELPESVKADFDHLDADSTLDGWIHYRRHWYHTSDFLRCNDSPDPTIATWHGYAADSFFSGVLIRLSEDGEQYQIATYIN